MLPIVGVPGLAPTVRLRVTIVEPHAFVCVYVIVTVPADTAVTVAVVEPVPTTVALALLLLVHAPPARAAVTYNGNVGVVVTEIANEPPAALDPIPVAVGTVLTVTTAVLLCR